MGSQCTLKIIINDYCQEPERAQTRGDDLDAKGWAVRYDVDAHGRYFSEAKRGSGTFAHGLTSRPSPVNAIPIEG
jgi:hypothetical protein